MTALESPAAALSACTPSVAALLERWVRTWMQYVPIHEKIGELGAHDREFRMTVESVRDALERMKFHRHIGISELLHEALAAFNGDGHVLVAVENHSRWKTRRNVCRGICGTHRCSVAARR